MERVWREATRALGQIDALINHAGIYPDHRPLNVLALCSRLELHLGRLLFRARPSQLMRVLLLTYAPATLSVLARMSGRRRRYIACYVSWAMPDCELTTSVASSATCCSPWIVERSF